MGLARHAEQRPEEDLHSNPHIQCAYEQALRKSSGVRGEKKVKSSSLFSS